MNEEALVLQIGNTTCKLIRMSGLDPVGEAVMSHADIEARIAQAHQDLCGRDPMPVILCSVVPAIADSALAILQPKILVTIDGDRVDWFNINYHPKSSLGSDRLCNAIALREVYGFPSLAVDCGTAITANVLDSNGDFIGGWIIPGLRTSASLLKQRTALLPRSDEFEHDTSLIGDSTEASIRSGILWSARFGIRHLRQEMERAFGSEVTMVFTGGDARLIADASEPNDPYLTAKGAAIYYARLKQHKAV